LAITNAPCSAVSLR